MKTIKYVIAAFIVALFSFSASAQSSAKATLKTETIKVSGNCEMCKSRIEQAAKQPGVTKANWDVKTKMLTLVYDPSKVKSVDVQKKIAAAGHDTPVAKADAKAYDKLHGCCKYR